MTFRAAFCLPLLASVLCAQAAQDPLRWVPRRAKAVILVNRPSQALARWDKLSARMKSKEMALVRQALTEDFGGLPILDPDAPLVEFMVAAPAAKAPSDGKDGAPAGKPKDIEFRILPFRSPDAFQARFKVADMAKAGSEFAAITVGGKPMVAAVRGSVAILAPKGQGALLKALLLDKARFAFPPEGELAWARSQDVAVIIPVGALKASEKPVSSASAKTATPIWAPMEKLSAALKAHPEKEIASLVMGVKLNEAGDLVGSLRLGIATGGELARMTSGLTGTGPAFRGLPEGPFALAFGMEIPKAWGDTMAEAVAEEAKKDPKSDAVAVAAMQGLFRQLRSLGLALRGPREGAPPASGLGLAMVVEDAGAFMGHAAVLASRPGKEGSSAFRMDKATFQGRPVMTFTSLPPEKKGGEEAGPSMMPPPEAIFGTKDVRSSLLAADDHTVIAGFGDTQAAFQAGLDSLGRGSFGQMARLQRTRSLTGQGQAAFYLSLPETLQMVSAFFPLPLKEEDLKKPAPPIGLTLNVTPARIDVNAALPVETLELIGRLLSAAAEMRKGPGKE